MQPMKLSVLSALTWEGVEPQESPWKINVPPPALTLGQARRSLTERKIEVLDVPTVQIALEILTVPIAIIVSVLFFNVIILFASPGSPFPTTFPPCVAWGPYCHKDSSQYPLVTMSQFGPAMAFWACITTCYVLLHSCRIYRFCKDISKEMQVEEQNKKNGFFNAKIERLLKLFPSAKCDSQAVPAPLAAAIVDYLSKEAINKLSFAQLDACREKNGAGFQKLLQEMTCLNREQRAYCHLLAHIEKAKAEGHELQHMLTFPGNLELLTQEPLLFEKILTTVKGLLGEQEHLVFFTNILAKHLLAQRTATILIEGDLLGKIVAQVASGRVGLEAAISDAMASAKQNQYQLGIHTLEVAPRITQFFEKYRARINQGLLSLVKKDELYIFVKLLTGGKVNLVDHYPLLKVSVAFNLKELFSYFEGVLADNIEAWIPFFELNEVLPEIENYPCLVLKLAINNYLSKMQNAVELAQIALTPPLDQLAFLASTRSVCRSALQIEIAELRSISFPSVFAKKLQSYAALPLQEELENVLVQWLSDFPTQGETLWLLAIEFESPWLQSCMLSCLKQKPSLLSYWNSPPQL